MAKLAALLIAACVVVAQANHLPNPNSFPRRCSRYDLYKNWDVNCLIGTDWIVVASSGAGATLGWETDYNSCDAIFTYGLDCCGGCNYITFLRLNGYTDYTALTMIQSSMNYCTGVYDYSESLFGQAYIGSTNVFRYFTRQAYDRRYMSYTDINDPAFIPYNSYTDDIAMSVGILDYNAQSQIIIATLCNNFNYMTYNNYPTVFILAQKPRLTRNEKNWVRDTLRRNGICPSGILFRENYNCPAREPYTPRYYIN